ncbi:MAG: LutC/YkgG family protein [Candidatus Rokuibacteriota bacterium]
MTTRGAFVSRIRAEMAKTRGLFPATVSERPAAPAAVAETIRRELAERWPETLERFRREFERVGGVFHRVAVAAEVPTVVARIARERQSHRLIAWPAAVLGVDVTVLVREGFEIASMPGGEVGAATERGALRETIAAADLGVTGADLAVAETGNLVLVSGRGRPRSTSLLPPFHVAVFDRSVLVESLQQMGVFLEAWHAGAAPADGGAINVITGPSRTADIELTLTRGVHGPKEVHAVFVDTPLHG